MDNSRDVGVETLDAYPDQTGDRSSAKSLRNELQRHFIGPTQAAAQFSENPIIDATVRSQHTTAVFVAILFPNVLLTPWGRMTFFGTLRAMTREKLKFTCSKAMLRWPDQKPAS